MTRGGPVDGQADPVGHDGVATAQPSDLETTAVMERHRRVARARSQRRLLLQAASLVVVIALWWAITAMGLVQPLYLPGPVAVWEAFLRGNTCYPAGEGSSRMLCGEQGYFIWEHLMASFSRIGGGVGAAEVLGPNIGFVLGSSRGLTEITYQTLSSQREL